MFRSLLNQEAEQISLAITEELRRCQEQILQQLSQHHQQLQILMNRLIQKMEQVMANVEGNVVPHQAGQIGAQALQAMPPMVESQRQHIFQNPPSLRQPMFQMTVNENPCGFSKQIDDPVQFNGKLPKQIEDKPQSRALEKANENFSLIDNPINRIQKTEIIRWGEMQQKAHSKLFGTVKTTPKSEGAQMNHLIAPMRRNSTIYEYFFKQRKNYRRWRWKYINLSTLAEILIFENVVDQDSFAHSFVQSLVINFSFFFLNFLSFFFSFLNYLDVWVV